MPTIRSAACEGGERRTPRLRGDWWFLVRAVAVDQETLKELQSSVLQSFAAGSWPDIGAVSSYLVVVSQERALTRRTADRKDAQHTSGYTRGARALAAARA